MATAIRMIGHEERLTLVDHLEELRWRLIVSVIAFAVALGVCFWQNHALLHVINAPLEQQTRQQVVEGNGPMGEIYHVRKGVLAESKSMERVLRSLGAKGSGLSASARASVQAEIPNLQAQIAKLSGGPQGYNPTAIGFGEPFTMTLTVAIYFALLISLPVLLYEVYGFVLPAFSPAERRVALPLLLSVPFLFVAGAVFGYYVVLPAAVHFFENFNSAQFNVLVQGSSYYKFAAIMLIAMGLVFQVPVAVVGATQAGIVTPRQLRKGRRYALLACAVIAAFIPGEVVTMALEIVPLYLLYEASILIAALLARRRERREASAAADAAAGGGDGPGPGGAGGALTPLGSGGSGPGGGAAPAGVGGFGPGGGAGGSGPGGAGGLGPGTGGSDASGDTAESDPGGAAALVGAGAPGPDGEQEVDPQVREMIDHVDPDLLG